MIQLNIYKHIKIKIELVETQCPMLKMLGNEATC